MAFTRVVKCVVPIIVCDVDCLTHSTVLGCNCLALAKTGTSLFSIALILQIICFVKQVIYRLVHPKKHLFSFYMIKPNFKLRTHSLYLGLDPVLPQAVPTGHPELPVCTLLKLLTSFSNFLIAKSVCAVTKMQFVFDRLPVFFCVQTYIECFGIL